MASDERWLYRTLKVKADMLERTIQGQGAAGWECVAVSYFKYAALRGSRAV